MNCAFLLPLLHHLKLRLLHLFEGLAPKGVSTRSFPLGCTTFPRSSALVTR